MAARVFLALFGLLSLPYGLYCFVDPGFLGPFAGVAATSTTGTVELRAMYGGLQTGFGALALLGALRPGLLRPALLATALLCAGLGGGWLGLGEAITLRLALGNKGVLPAVLLGVLLTAAASVIPFIGALVVTTMCVFAYGVALMTGLGARADWSHRRMHIPQAPEIAPTTGT